MDKKPRKSSRAAAWKALEKVVIKLELWQLRHGRHWDESNVCNGAKARLIALVDQIRNRE